jgi:protoporphyrinogen oxidase
MQQLPTGPLGLLDWTNDLSGVLRQGVLREVLASSRWYDTAFPSCLNGTDDESVYAFAERRFGGAVAKSVIDAMCRGIFAGDARTLSLAACFPLLRALEREHGSVVRGMVFAGGKTTTGSATGVGSVASYSVHEMDEFLSPETPAVLERAKKASMWSLRSGLQVCQCDGV